jgi:hypothetical protein
VERAQKANRFVWLQSLSGPKAVLAFLVWEGVIISVVVIAIVRPSPISDTLIFWNGSLAVIIGVFGSLMVCRKLRSRRRNS